MNNSELSEFQIMDEIKSDEEDSEWLEQYCELAKEFDAIVKGR